MQFAAFAFQDVPPAPAETTTGTAQPSHRAPEPSGSAAPATGGALMNLLPFIIIVPMIVLLFWSSRSQQKKQEATVAALKKGDRVVTQSGLIGRLAEVDKRYAKVELAPGVKVQMLRSSLAGREADETPSVPPSDKKS